MKSAIWILLAVALTGCMPSAHELAAADDQYCQANGLPPGTPGYATCRRFRDNRREDMTNAFMLTAPRPYVGPVAPVAACFPSGGVVYCR